MGMNAFELFGVLKLDSSAFESGLSKAGKMASSAGSVIGNGLATIARIGTAAIGVATTAVVGIGTSAVKAGSTFDQAMGTVAATLGTTTEEMQENIGEVDTAYGHFKGTLRDFAQFMGSNTTFTATQAAQALNYMALAGYNTEKSMKMLPSVLSMAAAGSMDLALASDMITDSQMALGISFERTQQMVDEFAKAASSGNTNVQQLGEAFLRVGALARETNGGFITMADGTQVAVDNIQELEIAFTALANRGIKGAEAGTHMRNMLLKLSNPTKDGAEALEKMGVQVFDTEGKMRGLSEIFGDLSAVMETMTQQEQLNVIGDLFNTRDMASAEGLLAAIGEDWNEIGAAILQAEGASDQMSKTKLNNLAGDITLFKSALEGAQIVLNDKLSPTLRDFVQMGTQGLQKVTEAFRGNGSLDDAMEAFGSWLSDALNMIVEKLPSIVKAGSKLMSALAQGLFDNLDKIIAAGISIVKEIGKAIVAGLPNLIDAGLQILEALLSTIDENFDAIAGAVDRMITGIGRALQKHGPKLFELVKGIALKIADVIMENLPAFVKTAAEIISSLMQGLAENLPTIVPTIVDVMMTIFNTIMENLPLLIDAAIQIIQALSTAISENMEIIAPAIVEIVNSIANIIIENLPLFIGVSMEVLLAIANGIVKNLPTLVPAIVQVVMSIVNTIIDNLPLLLRGAIMIIEELIGGIITNLPTLIKALPELVEAIVTGIVDNLPMLLEAAFEIIAQLVAGIIINLPEILIAAGKIIMSLVKGMADVMHKIGEFAVDLIKKFIEGIASVGGMLLDAGKGIIQKIKDGLFGKIEDAKNWGKDLIGNLVGGIKEKAGAVKDAVKGVGEKIKNFLGFSEPEEGPLSDFHTYAPDMMKLFAQGIKDNEGLLTDAVTNAFDLSDAIVGANGEVSVSGGGFTQGGNENFLNSILEALQGITVEVSIGGENIDGVITKSIQRTAYRSGGR